MLVKVISSFKPASAPLAGINYVGRICGHNCDVSCGDLSKLDIL